MQKTDQDHHCPHCGASTKEYWHSLTKGLLSVLVKVKTKVITLNRNEIHPIKDCELNYNEASNLQKLRYFALIAKSKKAGYWLLTRRGSEFLKGITAIPKRIRTFRGHIVERDSELVFVKDIFKEDLPIWEESFDFQYSESVDPIDKKIQEDLFA